MHRWMILSRRRAKPNVGPEVSKENDSRLRYCGATLIRYRTNLVSPGHAVIVAWSADKKKKGRKGKTRAAGTRVDASDGSFHEVNNLDIPPSHPSNGSRLQISLSQDATGE